MFGPHLIVDGSACNKEKLADRTFIEQLLNDYPDAIGMTKIGGPYIFDYQAPDPAYSGVSGFVIIAESHIAIHTFPELDYFTMDVFSCRNFDPEKAIEYIEEALEVKQMDRMLLQRGLSFRGPRHGKFGVPPSGAEELPLEAPQELAPGSTAEEAAWPTFGATPDYGTYGETAPEKLFERSALKEYIPLTPANPALIDVEPVLINPTASMSGLLENMSSSGGQARALGQMLTGWERMLRDPEMTVVLALSTPAIAKGLREVLVYAVEHHFIDLVILSAEDVFADLYESLGYSDYVPLDDLENLAPAAPGYQASLDCFTRFARELGDLGSTDSSDFWQRLGAYLPKHAPRKGLLQAAAASGVRLFTPDLGATTLGSALLALRARGLGSRLSLDITEDVKALAEALGSTPRLGVVRSGSGAADALLGQARAVAAAMTETSPLLRASISLGVSRPLEHGERHVALLAGADLILPIVVTALAQRVPAQLRRPAAVMAVASRRHSRSTTAT